TALDAAAGIPSGESKSNVKKPVAATWGKLALPAAPQAAKWQYAIDDIRDQLVGLAGPKCLSTTPWTWLRHCPRFFRAIRVRLEALPGAVAKDRERYEELLPHWQLYLDWFQ